MYLFYIIENRDNIGLSHFILIEFIFFIFFEYCFFCYKKVKSKLNSFINTKKIGLKVI